MEAKTIQDRYRTACGLEQAVDSDRILRVLTTWVRSITDLPFPIRILDSFTVQTSGSFSNRDQILKQALLHSRRLSIGDSPENGGRVAALLHHTNRPALLRAENTALTLAQSEYRIVFYAGAMAQFGETAIFEQNYPLFEAFEAGAWSICLTDDEVLVLPIPNRVDIDARSRPHSETRAALQWLDLEGYYLSGVECEARLVLHPETVTAQEILETRNIELRRVLLERMGYEIFFQQINAQELDKDFDPGGIRRLLRIEFRDQWSWLRDEPLVCLSVICPSTAHSYILRVPPTMTTCRQAAAWIAGFDNPDRYQPLYES